jgi:hypothetical protein
MHIINVGGLGVEGGNISSYLLTTEFGLKDLLTIKGLDNNIPKYHMAHGSQGVNNEQIGMKPQL